MSDLLRRATDNIMPGGISGLDLLKGNNLSAYEQELKPIFQQEMAQEKQNRSRISPVQWVFDRLQTGQYVSANVFNALLDALDNDPNTNTTLAQAIADGVTGRVKGSYADILRDRLNVGKQKLLPNAKEGSKFSQIDWAGVLGFIGDIVLDPTTYMTFGLTPVTKAAKTAKIAASEFATDSVRLALKSLISNPDELAKISRGALGKVQKYAYDTTSDGIKKVLSDLTKTGGEAGLKKVLSKGDDLGRFMDLTYRAAYDKGLVKTQKELLQETTSRLGQLTGDTGLQDISQRIAAGTAYQGAGDKFALRAFGKEIGVGQRGEIGKSLADNWAKTMSLFRGSPDKGGVRSALWAFWNRGAVGEIRRTFGFRNPYQKYLRALELDQGTTFASRAANEEAKRALNTLGDMKDEDLSKVLDFMAKKEEAAAKAVAGAPASTTIVGGADKEIEDKAWALKGVFDDWHRKEAQWAEQLGEDASSYYDWYVPEKFRLRETMNVNPTRGRKYTYAEQVQKEKDLLKFAYGMDDDLAQRIVDQNVTGISTDLREMVVTRALTHARAKTRFNMVNTFREFGINKSDLPDATRQALQMGGRTFEQLGLKSIDHPLLADYVFDYDVADIFKNALDITSKEKNIFQRAMAKYANWWKSIVTMTTGFHARNFLSNQTTQFLRHGVRAFDPKSVGQASAGVAYILHGSNPAKFMQDFGMDHTKMNAWLDQRIGNMTIRELADEAAKRNVITEATMGFDAKNILEKVSGQEKKGIYQTAQKGSRAIGNYVENIPRFQSFLIDYADSYRPFVADITKSSDKIAVDMVTHDAPVLDWAANEAKKWFIDYGNLTKFEQDYMKNIIPFYCVPDDAEALTRDGWKRHGEIEVGDEILTYNQSTGKQEWQPVQAINEFPFDGNLEVLSGKQGSYRCTANHKWPVETCKTFSKGKWYGGEQKLIETKDLNTNHVLRLASETDDQDSILTPREAALLGWLVTDGYFRWRGNHFESMIYQKKEGSVNVIRQLAGMWISSESTHPDTGVICMRLSTAWALKVNKYFKSKDDLPKIVTRLSNNAALAMWESMMIAEGHVNPHKKFSSFAQTPGPVLDAFQILSQILGKPFGFSIKENKSEWGKKPIANGYIRNRTNLKVSYLKKKKSPYRGLVWCPTVENHTWVMRQNGKTIITGNSWIRNNLANQINGVMLYPELYSLLPKIEDFVTYQDPNYDPSLIPDWMRNEGMFAIGKSETGMERMFRPDFAHMDLNLLPFEWNPGQLMPTFNGTDLRDTIINAAAPWVKEVASAMIPGGYDFFYKEQLKPTADAPYLMRLFASNPGTMAFIDGLLKTVGIKDGAKLSLDDNGKLQMDGKMAHLLEQFLPTLRQGAFLFYLPQTIFPGLETVIEKYTGAQDDYEGTEQIMKMLSFYLGVKSKDVDLEKEKQNLGWDIYYKARDALTEMRKQQPGYEQRSMDSRQRTLQSIRRLGG